MPEVLAARVAALEEALAPFAKGAKQIPADWPDTRAFLIGQEHPDNPKSHDLLVAFVSDFRRAANLIGA